MTERWYVLQSEEYIDPVFYVGGRYATPSLKDAIKYKTRTDAENVKTWVTENFFPVKIVPIEIGVVNRMCKTLYLLIGPSGVGKTSLGTYLKQWGIPELISHTTRPMRKGESYSSPYYFVDIDTFYATEMVEYTEYNGYLYGTSKTEVDRVLGANNSRAFAIVDRVGVEAFKALYPDITKVIYIYASGKDLIERMTVRGDDPDIIAERIAHAYTTGEFNNIDIADYCIVNKDLDVATTQLKAIVGNV
jgi:guanylate kinase